MPTEARGPAPLPEPSGRARAQIRHGDRWLTALALAVAAVFVACLIIPGLGAWVGGAYARFPLLLPSLALLISLLLLRAKVRRVNQRRNTAWDIYEFFIWGGFASYQVYRLASAGATL